MQVSIEVNEEQFKELLEKELKDLPKESVQKILLSAIEKYLEEPNHVNAFLEKKQEGYYSTTVGPSDFLINTIKKCDYSELQCLVDDMIKELEDNYRDVLINAIGRMIVNGICNTSNFDMSVETIIRDTLRRANNPNN